MMIFIFESLLIVIFIGMLSYFAYYFYKNIFLIEELKPNKIEVMESLEKTYRKKYLMGNDFYRIIHYPSYNTFFKQFSDYKYLVRKKQNQIISTCCFANLNNDIYYMCDLKKIGSEHNQTFDFVRYAYMVLGIRKIFGIVMEPNPIINNLAKRYGFVKQAKLNLYKVKFSIIKKNYYFFNKLFPNFFLVPGYKKFILESNGIEIKCYHIAQITDRNFIVKLQQPVPFYNLSDSDDIMFCLNSNSRINYLLELKNIFPTNKMSIISNKLINKEEFNFDLIKTYMI